MYSPEFKILYKEYTVYKSDLSKCQRAESGWAVMWTDWKINISLFFSIRIAFEMPRVKDSLTWPFLQIEAKEIRSLLALTKTRGKCKVSGQFSYHTSCQKLIVWLDPTNSEDLINKILHRNNISPKWRAWTKRKWVIFDKN
jgi:hypothetical protein